MRVKMTMSRSDFNGMIEFVSEFFDGDRLTSVQENFISDADAKKKRKEGGWVLTQIGKKQVLQKEQEIIPEPKYSPTDPPAWLTRDFKKREDWKRSRH
jgi:hypothetical protein